MIEVTMKCHACGTQPIVHLGAHGGLCASCAEAFVESPEGRRYLASTDPVVRRVALACWGRDRKALLEADKDEIKKGEARFP